MKALRALIAVAMTLVVIGVISPPASAAPNYYPPYPSGFSGYSTDGVGCGRNDIFAYPTAYPSNGKLIVDAGSWGLGCGAYAIRTWLGFWGHTFTPTTTGYRTITYKFQIWWDATVSTSLCFLGASWAEGSIKFYANLYDATSFSWKLQNNAVRTVWSNTFACGLSWGGSQDGAVYYVSFSVYLLAGHTYQFYSYMETFSLAGALGFATANARNNVGTNGDTAYLVYTYRSGS